MSNIIKLLLLSLIATLAIYGCKSSSRSSNSALSAETKLRANILKEAERYKGTKYKTAGKTPKGFDCSGYTSYICSKFDIQLSSSSTAQSKQGQEIAINKAKPGDLLFFGRNGRNGKIQHVGIVYKNNTDGLFMIHSSSKRGIVVDNVTTSKYWKPKLLFARKILSLQEK
jgi:cell wall-associated NlpC family hydrolase